MAKKRKHLTDQISFLAPPGTLLKLEAIGYFRGRKGKKGVAAREMFERGMRSFLDSLEPAEARRFREIVASLKLAVTLQREDNSP